MFEPYITYIKNQFAVTSLEESVSEGSIHKQGNVVLQYVFL